MRLIDADALCESIMIAEMGTVYKFCFPCKEMQQAIDEQQTIDAVHVIRCKDCKYYHKEWDGTEKHHHEDYWCEWVEPDENDFCSLAERRSE